MIWLRQSTAATIILGPFVSSTDGFTPSNALSIVQTDVRVSKNGLAYAAKHDPSSSPIAENGNYTVTLDTTDTGTMGFLRIDVQKSGALPVWQEALIVTQNVYDSLFSSDRLQVDVEEIGPNMITATTIATDAISAAKLAADASVEIATTLFGTTVDTFNTQASALSGSATFKQALSIILAVLAGRTTANGATIQTPDGAQTRVAATIDSTNNRTAMTLTPST